jgi:hypothetical protein
MQDQGRREALDVAPAWAGPVSATTASSAHRFVAALLLLTVRWVAEIERRPVTPKPLDPGRQRHHERRSHALVTPVRFRQLGKMVIHD